MVDSFKNQVEEVYDAMGEMVESDDEADFQNQVEMMNAPIANDNFDMCDEL